MTRKDTILIAVIINAGLLAILFTTAIIYDTEKDLIQSDDSGLLVEAKGASPANEPHKILAYNTPASEENLSKPYSEPVATAPLEQEQLYFQDPQPAAAEEAEAAPTLAQPEYVEVTVKKGDVLEKIARANGTTISAIKKANGLTNERLSIGQVLRIPVKKEGESKSNSSKTSSSKTADGQAVYHTVKSGDSPWKIAKQHGVNYEDILLLNQLDEASARNLKVGDRVRVK